MILKIIFGIVIGMCLIGLAVFIHEIRHAPIVDDKEPFLWDER